MPAAMGVDDVKVAKHLHAERGFAVAESFGSKYVEFAPTAASGPRHRPDPPPLTTGEGRHP